ncbi:MAG: ABC transporter permease [Coriobacteriia bacterium]|nr:ABC transporter permease [Coriobacteriia bacterium]
MNDLRLVLRNLFGSRSRFALTLTGITVGITALVVMMSLGGGLRAQIERQATDLGANLIVTPKGWCAYEQVKVLSGDRLPDAILPADVEAIEAIDGVAVLPYLTVGSAIGNEPVAVTGIRVADTIAAKRWSVAEGTAPSDGESGVLAGAAAAETFGLTVGDEVVLRGEPFEVLGVIEPTGTGDDGVLFAPLDVAQRVYETDGRVSFLSVSVADITEVDLYAQRITDAANVAVISDRQLLASVLSVVDTVGTTLTVIAAVAVLTAAFGIINTMLMATLERRREIGILKSLGSSNGRVFRVFMLEAAAYGVLGGIVGLLVGTAASHVITPLIAENEFTAFVGGARVAAVPPVADMVTILFGAVLVSVLSGVYPAWRAARLAPVEAISYE